MTKLDKNLIIKKRKEKKKLNCCYKHLLNDLRVFFRAYGLNFNIYEKDKSNIETIVFFTFLGSKGGD